MYVIVEEYRDNHAVSFDIVGPWFHPLDAVEYQKYSEADNTRLAQLVPVEMEE